MSESPLPQSVIQWLDAATDGLPVQRANDIRKELLAHYEDAVEDYRLLGKTEAEAQQQAQIDLGEAAAVNREFNNLYRGRRRYFTALFCSFITLWLAVGLIQTVRGLGAADLTTMSRLLTSVGHVVNLALIVYIVQTLKQLLNWQFNLSVLDPPIQFIIGCASVGLGGSAVLELIISSWNPLPTAFNVGTAPEALFVLIRDGGYLALGVAVLWLAYCLQKSKIVLHGLDNVLALGAFSLGVGVWVQITMTYLDSTLGMMVGYLLVMLGDLVIWPTLGMLFFRAAYRAPQIAFRNA
jgi:hypothetical protein